MIQITAYLRDEEDLARWKAIGNKSAFLHDALVVQDSTLHGTMYQKQPKFSAEPMETDKKVIKTKKDAEEVIPEIVPPVAKNISRQSNGLCKIHGTPLDGRGKCLQKGCKYS